MVAPSDAELALWQARLDVSPFQRWLGLKLEEVAEGSMTIGLDWRADLVSNPAAHSVHGGVLASVIDLGGLYAILTANARAAATIDLAVDYHRPFVAGRLRSCSKVLRLGSKVSSAETRMFDAEGALIASGRGVYLMASADGAVRDPRRTVS